MYIFSYKFRYRPLIFGVKTRFQPYEWKTTHEDAPSNAQNLSLFDVAPRSLKIQWDKPSEVNGRLNGYVIYVNGTRVNSTNETTVESVVHNLLPRTTYNVTVVACTNVGCSPNSTLFVTTDVGGKEVGI